MLAVYNLLAHYKIGVTSKYFFRAHTWRSSLQVAIGASLFMRMEFSYVPGPDIEDSFFGGTGGVECVNSSLHIGAAPLQQHGL